MAEGCPELEMLAAYLEGNLFLEEKRSIQAHIAKCWACRKTMALAVKTEAEAAVNSAPDLADE